MKSSWKSCAPSAGWWARTLTAMGEALEPGMTTRELDDLGRALLEKEGARSAPELTYDFPGATCISVGPDCAHGIPDDTAIKAGDLINIDVSAELDGYFGDTGASFAVPPTSPRIERLCEDGRRAMWAGIKAVKPGVRLNEIGRSIEDLRAEERLQPDPQSGEPRHRAFAARRAVGNPHLVREARPPEDHRRTGLHDRAVPVVGRRPCRRNGRWLDPAPAAAPGHGAVRTHAGRDPSRTADPDAGLSGAR